MKAHSLHDLFITKIQALYDIENNLIKALPKMAQKAVDSKLKKAFEDHLKETEEHKKRLEKVFSLMKQKPEKLKVEAIRGLVADGDWVAKNTDEVARDAGLIAAGQYVEHYEMAGYGSASEWAKEMGHTEAADLLVRTLEEEKEANQKLNTIAKESANITANQEHP